MSTFTITLLLLVSILTVSSIIILLLVFFRKQKYKNQAFTDYLTGVWNTRKFCLETEKLIRRTPQQNYAVIQADIREFKFINQTIGVTNANKIIKNFAQNLKEAPKEIEIIHFARDYADRFCILISITNIFDCHDKAENLYTFLTEKSLQQNYQYVLKFGVAPVGRDFGFTTIEDTIGKATYTNSMIKGDLVTKVALVDDVLFKNQMLNQQMERSFDSALTGEEFFVMYQPKVDLKTEKVTGAEALVRWRNPEKGILSPGTFIPVLEKDGYIMRLDFYVYKKVFEFIQERLREGKPVVPVSVNMSRSHLLTYNFVHNFMELFFKYDIPPQYIQIEVLERATGETDNMLVRVTKELQSNGFKVAMDDFGSGESSLNMLHTIPVDIIKLDRFFLYQAERYEDSKVIITKVIEMARDLHKETVCEGVETQTQVNLLKNIGCDMAQGFFYSKPLNQNDFSAYIDAHL